MKPFPDTFEAFNAAFHNLEAAIFGKDSSASMKRALNALGNAQDLYNEDASGFGEEMHPSDVADIIADLMYYTAKMEGWKACDVEGADHIGTLELDDGNSFEVLNTGDKLVFGGACNAGFLESGFMLRDPSKSLDEDIQGLKEDLEAYYDSKGHVSIYCNDRM